MGALAWFAVNVQSAAQHLHALIHGAKTHRPFLPRFGQGLFDAETGAVVIDDGSDAIILDLHRDARLGGLSVIADVVEQLLHNTKDRDLNIGIQSPILAHNSDLDRDIVL